MASTSGSTSSNSGNNKKKKRKLIKRLRKYYRLVIMSDDNFEIKTSVILTPMNVVLITSVVSVVFIILVASIIIFTPLKENIPGYEYNDYMKERLTELRSSSDDLNQKLTAETRWAQTHLKILNGDVTDWSMDAMNQNAQTGQDGDEVVNNQISYERPPQVDSLKSEQERLAKNAFAMIDGNAADIKAQFVAPLRGHITQKFNKKKGHFGIDVVADEGTSIKAIKAGRVIFNGWTAEDGYVIAIQHEGNFVSMYKHNSTLLKKTSNFVRAGDVIAIIGNSGERSQGPHLHFEIWENSQPIDPTDYISFE